jgi:hypothetical protein
MEYRRADPPLDLVPRDGSPEGGGAVSDDDFNHFPAGRPHAAAGNRFLAGIDFANERGEIIASAQYADLRSPGRMPDMNRIAEFFFDTVDGHMKVKLEGRNLLRLYRYIRDHRMPWVQEIPPGKEPTDLKPTDAVVHKITIDFVKPQERGR